jgi:hypothetical protein
MTGGVIIIIPTQGSDTGAFETSARTLDKKVYGGRATILKAMVNPTASSFDVAFSTLKGVAFSWTTAKDVSRVLTISHAFSCDGPNLAYHAGGYQPWGSQDNVCEALSEGGRSFWESVGNAMASDGQVILLGCFMGGGDYAKLVADATGRPVYASESLFAAGNADTAVKYVRAIEAGKVPRPMKKFGPTVPAR